MGKAPSPAVPWAWGYFCVCSILPASPWLHKAHSLSSVLEFALLNQTCPGRRYGTVGSSVWSGPPPPGPSLLTLSPQPSGIIFGLRLS